MCVCVGIGVVMVVLVLICWCCRVGVGAIGGVGISLCWFCWFCCWCCWKGGTDSDYFVNKNNPGEGTETTSLELSLMTATFTPTNSTARPPR